MHVKIMLSNTAMVSLWLAPGQQLCLTPCVLPEILMISLWLMHNKPSNPHQRLPNLALQALCAPREHTKHTKHPDSWPPWLTSPLPVLKKLTINVTKMYKYLVILQLTIRPTSWLDPTQTAAAVLADMLNPLTIKRYRRNSTIREHCVRISSTRRAYNFLSSGRA